MKPEHFRDTNNCGNCKHFDDEEPDFLVCAIHGFEIPDYDLNTVVCNDFEKKEEKCQTISEEDAGIKGKS